MKKVFLFLLLSILIAACTTNENKDLKITDHIPEDSEFILFTPDISQFKNELNSSEITASINYPFKSQLLRDLQYLEHYNLKQAALAFSKTSNKHYVYTIIAKADSSSIQLDSIQNKSLENITEKDFSYKKVQIENSAFIEFRNKNLLFLSNSKENLQQLINSKKTLQDEDFKKAYAASDPNKNSMLFNSSINKNDTNFLSKLFQFADLKSFASWSILDLELSRSELKLNGVSITKTVGAPIFSKIKPKKIEVGKICPENFNVFKAIGYDDFSKLNENLINKAKDTIPSKYPGILDHTREIALINLMEGSLLALNTVEIESANEQLTGKGERIESFRGFPVFKWNSDSVLPNHFELLFPELKPSFYTVIEHFIIFSEQQEALEELITAYQNSDLLASRSYYTEVMNSLSSESSVLSVNRLSDNGSLLKEKHSLNRNALAAFQFIQEDNFAHLHGIIYNPEAGKISAKQAKQTRSLKLDAPVAVGPFYFKNHRSDQLDIAVQDEKNTLYLISNKGTIFWKKKLDTRIQGDIHEVDLFKNGNKQLAFSTGFKLEVIDRTGKTVKPFPVEFNDPITQPVSVFDYDNNRNYRFVLVQNKQVFMVGPKGKAIKGFDFEKASAEIIKPPKHIRLGTKDYILITEKTGKLNILSRQGNIRVPLKKDLNLSENEWFEHKGHFVTTTDDHKLLKIDQKGGIVISDLGLAENSKIIADERNLIYLSENVLSINDKKVELDFGLYTNPQVFKGRSGILVSLTDTQTQKVYVFNQNAELLNGFPVYGNSRVDISNADIDSQLELIVKGEENEILIYEF
ncbi:hypothetical protein [Christiangramia salexigens]|uniref:Uncharacterized protein n=1 Tax=Christiangramia salexigens TaxID=1913577 RepID=A0A1L3J7J2_9FLAO|nr:hypothetical protein [Christiangramia salexigens]APG61095.1 hypothetical protein LPB144_12060 [Christiangramia salexigens]